MKSLRTCLCMVTDTEKVPQHKALAEKIILLRKNQFKQIKLVIVQLKEEKKAEKAYIKLYTQSGWYNIHHGKEVEGLKLGWPLLI